MKCERVLVFGIFLFVFLALECQCYPQPLSQNEISWTDFRDKLHRLENYYNFLKEMDQTSSRIQRSALCANIWDDGCINGQVIGAGSDSGFLEGGGTPGKRFIS